jgi:hypothetical protein
LLFTALPILVLLCLSVLLRLLLIISLAILFLLLFIVISPTSSAAIVLGVSV